MRLAVAAGEDGWGEHPERGVRPALVVVVAPVLDQDWRFGQAAEQLHRQQLVADAAAEALDVRVLPGRAGLDVRASGAREAAPVPERLGSQLGAVVLVADRGMVTRANLEAIREASGVAWITALKAPQVKRLARTGAFQPSLFDEHNLAEITSEEFPGERLVVCRNPLVAAERARKREALLAATETDLEPIAERVAAGRLTDAAEIGLAVGEVIKRHRVKKHFALEIADGRFSYARKSEQIAEEAALDGIYVLRTSVASERLDTPDVVRAYKQLKEVERDFRVLKGPELEIRPIHHRLEQRVRAHVFLCTLALYVEWHLRQACRELTFHDQQRRHQPDPVAKATRSPAARRKAATKTTSAGQPAHTLRSLLAELRLQTRNTIRLADSPATFTKLAKPSPLQARALELADSITIQ